MRITRTRIIGAAAAATLAAGGGAALAMNRTAADSPRPEREAFLADVAGRLGVSVEELRKAFREAAEARGWRGGPHSGRHFGPHARQGARHAVRQAFDAAADYLGLSRPELRSRLRAGDSLAEIAEAEGKSVDALKQALRESISARLDRAVADGRITEAQRQELLDRLDEKIDDLVQRSRGHHFGGS
jgi:hypothetical protein